MYISRLQSVICNVYYSWTLIGQVTVHLSRFLRILTSTDHMSILNVNVTRGVIFEFSQNGKSCMRRYLKQNEAARFVKVYFYQNSNSHP